MSGLQCGGIPSDAKRGKVTNRMREQRYTKVGQWAVPFQHHTMWLGSNTRLSIERASCGWKSSNSSHFSLNSKTDPVHYAACKTVANGEKQAAT